MVDSALHVRLRGIQGNEYCYTNLFYRTADNTVGVTAAGIYADFMSDFETQLEALWSEKFELVEVHIRAFINAGTQLRQHTGFVSIFGDVVGDAMPPNITFTAVKYPDPLTFEGVTAQPFGLGRLALSGVPESSQDNGVLDTTVGAAWQSLCDDLMLFSSQGVNWALGMYRNVPNISGNDTVLLQDIQASQFVGTQNTRKRR